MVCFFLKRYIELSINLFCNVFIVLSDSGDVFFL